MEEISEQLSEQIIEKSKRTQAKGIHAALASALFLGFTPVFGKLAIRYGLPPLAVVALRTLFATSLIFILVLVRNRSYLYIYPAGLLGCLLAGSINGIGSIFFYISLGRIDASLGQIIFSLYPLFVAIWLWLDRQPPSRLTIIRLLLVIPALILLTHTSQVQIDLVGVGFMLVAGAMYALHLPINQRVLYDMPAPTVTFYTLLAMSLVVLPALFFSGISTPVANQAWWALSGLTLVTFISRLTLFLGVKHLGGMQTAMLGLTELLITISFSHILLQERLNLYQWMGLALLAFILFLVRYEKPAPVRAGAGGWLSWLVPPQIPSKFPWQPHD
jgi:drug/metabolite transporter (DMT)-like permease